MNAVHAAVQAVAHHTNAELKQVEALMKAHGHAQDFHGAMEDAFDAERELLDRDGDPTGYWQKEYRDALGRAAAALQKMPARWAAILQCELPRE